MRKTTRIERLHRRRRRRFILVLLIGLVAFLVFFALNSDIFLIKTIEVKGNFALSQDDILDKFSVNKGENIFKVRLSDGRKDIGEIPYIKKVNIKRNLPDTISINIEERKEIALIQNLSMYLLVDEEGYILDYVDRPKEDLPVIKGQGIKDVKLGENIFLKDTEDMTEFVTRTKEMGILEKARLLELDENGEINISLKNGIDIAFGSIDNVKYKLELLNEILDDIKKKNINCKKIIMNKGNHPVLELDD